MVDGQALGRTLREHIGGRWAIPWMLYLTILPLAVIVTAVAGSAWGSDVATLAARTAIEVAGYAAAGGVLLLASVTVLRHRRERPVAIWVVISVGATAGLVAAFILVWLKDVTGLVDATRSELVIFSLNRVVRGAIALPLMALVTSSVMEYRQQRAALIAERITWEQQRRQVEGVSAELRVTLRAAVTSDLEAALAAADDPAQNPVSAAHAVGEVGRELWSASLTSPAPRLRLTEIMHAALHEKPFVIVPMVVLWLPVATVALLRVEPPVVAVLRAIASAVVLWGVLSAGDRLRLRWPTHTLSIVMGTVVVAWLLMALGLWAVGPLSQPQGHGLWLNSGLFIMVTLVLTSLVTALLRNGELVLDRLCTQVSDAEIAALAAEADLSQTRRALAIELHGPVRSRLTAATALLSGLQAPAAPSARDALAAALASLTDSAPEAGTSVADALHAACVPWGGVVDVRVECPDLTSPLAPLLGQAADEAIANAYRHGGAANVAITVAKTDAGLRLQVVDDGGGVSGCGTPGLGSTLLTSLGTWTLQAPPHGGSVLTLEIDESR